MGTLAISAALGMAGALLCVLTWRVRLAVWVALMPLAAAAWLATPLTAAVAGLIFGAVACLPDVWRRYPFNRRFERIVIAANGLVFAAAMAAAAWAWPGATPAWGLAAFPAAMVAATGLPARSGGRLANGVLGMAQRYLTLVHIARLGNDQAVTAVLALWSVLPVVLFAQWPPAPATVAAVAACAALAGAALTFGGLSLVRAVRAADAADRIRVAAVAADLDVAAELPGQEPRGNLTLVIDAYEPLLAQAAKQGARLVVLPETAAWVSDGGEKARWLDTLSRWARQGETTLVAGMFDEAARRNQAVVIGPEGHLLASYDKRHPFGAGESVTRGHEPPAAITSPVRLSAAICFDLDFSDLVRPVRRHGGVLAAPSNDWEQYADIHHRAAIWVPVCTRTTLIRATSHGITAIIDPAGRTLARASTFDGHAVLVADIPLAPAMHMPAAAARPASSQLPSVQA